MTTENHDHAHDGSELLSLDQLTASSPQMQPLARDPKTMETKISALFVLSTLCFVGFGVAYWQDANFWLYGALLGAGMSFVGVGLVAWGKYLMPRGPFVEERHELASTPEERNAFAAALVERGGVTIKRRKVLGTLLGASMGAVGVVSLFPLLRSLGPLPGDTLQKTDWKKGTYLVGSNGRRVHIGTMTVGGSMTVFPEGLQDTDNGQAVDQTMLIRLEPNYPESNPANFKTKTGRENWGPSGYVAYSKLCTHLGCPVGLYEQQLELLVCPCHQSMFNVREAAQPIFGPAPRPLPQLPLAVDANGFLFAADGYTDAVGPGFWERS